MNGEAVEETSDAMEWEGQRYATKVREILQEREQPLDLKHAHDILATLDAENDITAYMDTDEVDVFLDEFEEAFKEAEEKHDKIEDAADDKKKDKDADAADAD
jgi:hypothetical protein